MKKFLMFCVVPLLCGLYAFACVFYYDAFVYWLAHDHYDESKVAYFIGKQDPYNHDSTIGQFVRLGDMGGVAETIGYGRYEGEYGDYIKIRVTKPFWGCKKGQVITIRAMEPQYVPIFQVFMSENGDVTETETRVPLYPFSKQPFAFTATTNKFYSSSYGGSPWNGVTENQRAEREQSLYGSMLNGHLQERDCFYRLTEDGRSWWYLDEEEGRLTRYFTNAVNTLRIQRNWTNFYEVCRDASRLPGNAGKNARDDLHRLVWHGTGEQLLHMRKDPLFPHDQCDLLKK